MKKTKETRQLHAQNLLNCMILNREFMDFTSMESQLGLSRRKDQYECSYILSNHNAPTSSRWKRKTISRNNTYSDNKELRLNLVSDIRFYPREALLFRRKLKTCK